ncbi:hypothetical protein OROGR_004152 [Orobanche gracilis]
MHHNLGAVTMKLECGVVVFLLISLASADPFVGGWNPIPNINDPYVTEIAEFSITEHNKNSGENLKLEKVINGESQAVAGRNYRLTLTASDGSRSSHNYEATVWDKPWMHFRSLESFVPVN